MDRTGLLAKIVLGAININRGRQNLASDGFEHAGRLLYEDGIATAFGTFKRAQASADPRTMVLVELTFLQQELNYCHETDAFSRNSLLQAIQGFEDALRSLKTVENSVLYRGAETTYPMLPKYRHRGLPRDAVHLACAAHKTRLQNSLRTVGVNMIEKAVLTQRAANMLAIQGAHAGNQRTALGE